MHVYRAKDVESKAEAKSQKSPTFPSKKKSYKSDSENEDEDYLDSVGMKQINDFSFQMRLILMIVLLYLL